MPLFSSSILFPFCPPSQHPGKAARPFPYPQEHGATDLPLTENKTGIMFRKNRKKQNRNKLPTILQKKRKMHDPCRIKICVKDYITMRK